MLSHRVGTAVITSIPPGALPARLRDRQLQTALDTPAGPRAGSRCHGSHTGAVARTPPCARAVEGRSAYQLGLACLGCNGPVCAAALCGCSRNLSRARLSVYLRDSLSLTRPAYIELDVEALLIEGLLAYFCAFWLRGPARRFGSAEALPAIAPRGAGGLPASRQGATVRGKLGYKVAETLWALGAGFISQPGNGPLRSAVACRQRRRATNVHRRTAAPCLR